VEFNRPLRRQEEKMSHTLKVEGMSSDELVQVLDTIGFPGGATFSALKGEVTAFIEAARAHITRTRCGYDVGSFEFSELPAHSHGGNILRGCGRKVSLFGGDRHGYCAHKGVYGELDVELYIEDTGASDDDSVLKGTIDACLEGMRNGTRARWESALGFEKAA
jgi:hypothetical protein